MAVEKIQVVGAGQMFSGIAQVAAQAGLAVHLADVDEATLGAGLETIEKNLSRSVEKERISREEMDETLARIESGTEYAADADLAIEAVVETAEAKTEVFQALDERLGKTPSWPATPPPSPSPSWRPLRGGRRGSSVCTSSTPCRS